ncbi:MAG TPA: DUF3850 domain-containing protein [Candidatus Norongarragalinales archaeon]|jgi:hypothetical protein|nr:DUF3850 domain-containing protein [Candidatus Norongarragalinales archaeon]
MMLIRKKVWTDNFDVMQSGKRKFTIRLGDFVCRPGDTLVLEEWDPKTKKFTGRTMEKKVADVVSTKKMPSYWPAEEIEKYGYQFILFE